jgi:hypothetical protein
MVVYPKAIVGQPAPGPAKVSFKLNSNGHAAQPSVPTFAHDRGTSRLSVRDKVSRWSSLKKWLPGRDRANLGVAHWYFRVIWVSAKHKSLHYLEFFGYLWRWTGSLSWRNRLFALTFGKSFGL